MKRKKAILEKIEISIPKWLHFGATWITIVGMVIVPVAVWWQFEILLGKNLAKGLLNASPYLYAILNFFSAFATVSPFILLFLKFILKNYAETYINETIGEIKNLPYNFTSINAQLVLRKLLIAEQNSAITILDEFLTFTLIDAIISQNSSKIEKASFILSCKSGTLNFELLKQIQITQREIKDYQKKITKIYKVLSPIEYDPENFKNQDTAEIEEIKDDYKTNKSLKWLHQIEYSKLFFGEAFDVKENNNIVVYILGTNEHIKNKFESNTLSEFSTEEDAILIKLKRKTFYIIIKRDPINFDFLSSEIRIKDNSDADIKPFEKFFSSISRSNFWWKAEDFEYAIMSAEYMKTSAKQGCFIFASDAYLDTILGSWENENTPKGIVYEACKQILKKSDENEDPLVPILRLFIIDKTDTESKERIWELIKTLLLQEHIKVEAKIALENELEKTIIKLKKQNLFYDDAFIAQHKQSRNKESKSDTHFVNQNIESISNIVPDFSCIIKRNDNQKNEVVCGVNYQFGNSNYRKGLITYEEEEWNEIIDILWNKVPSKTIAEYYFLWYLGKQFEDEKKERLPISVLELFGERTNSVSKNENFWSQYLFWENFWKENDVKLRDNKSDSIFSPDFKDLNGKEISHRIKSYFEDKNVLEIGCCPDGKNSQFILEKKARALTIVEQSISAIEKFDIAWSKLDYSIVHGVAQYLPSSFLNSFDTIVCLDLLNHWDDWDQLIDQFYNVLKPGGILIANALTFNNHFSIKTTESDYELLEKKWKDKGTIIPTYNMSNNICFSIKSSFESESGHETKLLMHYCNDDFINSKLKIKFSCEIFKYNRNDPGHKVPFDTEMHMHEFYCIIATKI